MASFLTRRQLFRALAATAVASPAVLRAQEKPRLVVVGGGAGGAIAAKSVAFASAGAIDVTLVEANPQFTSCFFSNLYLGGFRSFEFITHGYGRLASHGIRKVTATATAVDRERRTVVLNDGSTLPYDRLLLSPGIDIVFDSVPGYSEAAAEIAPHAWKAGPQTRLLKDKLDALEDGQTIVMVAPPNPYRCPPGPYERASMFAHVLKAKGHTRSRIVILDAKEKFSKQTLFEEGWAKHYPGMIEWYGPAIHGGIVSVDAQAGTVETGLDIFAGDLLNVIPAQRAGAIAAAAGLTDRSGYCPIEAASMRSAVDPDIFVVGDASIAGEMPKSAFSAASQARVAARAISADLLGMDKAQGRYANTCWSLIAEDDGVKLGGLYEPKDGRIAAVDSFISQPGEPPEIRKETYEESVGWYAGMVEEMFE